jgi:serine/threonine-protein kinase
MQRSTEKVVSLSLSKWDERTEKQAAPLGYERASGRVALRTPPRTVGRYTIFDEIAAGGLGSVRFARLTAASGFARTVVVKIPHPQYARSREFALMFIDEARLAARIRHPNVVSVLDVIETAADLALVMDYVHGESLGNLMDAAKETKRSIPLEVATSIIIDVLHGLHAAHEATSEDGKPLGIVHRDVSPQNILVGVDGIARIVDFGIAMASGRLQATTDVAMIKGKYPYMAPEQIRGEVVSRLTDTFAAAIVFWELLTGARLFHGATQAETMSRCLTMPIPPPSQFAPDLPLQIDQITKKALARDPSQRYQSAREMALELEVCVAALRPSEIGDWVQRMAADALDTRSAVLAEIERWGERQAPVEEEMPTPGNLDELPTPELREVPTVNLNEVPTANQNEVPTVPVELATLDIDVTLAEPVSATDLAPQVQGPPSADAFSVTSGSGPRPRGVGGPPRRVRAVGSWLAALSLLGFAATLGIMEGPRLRWASFANRSPVKTLDSAPSAEHQAGLVTPSAGSSSAAASDPVVPNPSAAPPSAPPSSAPESGSARARNKAPQQRVAPPRTPEAKPASSCDPPYWIDSSGRTVFKRECL